MNNEQMELIKSFEKMKSSSLYSLALDAKQLCYEQNKSKDDIRGLVFSQLCKTAAWYGARGPKNFPLPLNYFIYIGGKTVDKNSDYFKQFNYLFTQYDNYNFFELLRVVSNALSQWNDPTDIAAITMFSAIQVVMNVNNENDLDTTLMYMMQGTDIDNDNSNPEGVTNSSLLWAFTAVYLDFEERLKRIVDTLVLEAE